MQIFNNFFEFLLAPMEPKNLILLNFPKKAYHAHPPPPPHSEGYSPMVVSGPELFIGPYKSFILIFSRHLRLETLIPSVLADHGA